VALAVAAAVVIAGAVAGSVLWERARAVTPAALLARLPLDNALVFYADFDVLRHAGILQLLDGYKAGEDPDYLSFVGQTRFNYKRDLDMVVAAFAPTGKFLLVKGRFDWPSLRAYVASQGGRCRDEICRMAGSAPERRISFFPLRRDLMALAVSPDDSAAVRLNTVAGAAAETPDGPLWISIPVGMLQSGENLPDGTRNFARSLGQAETVTMTFAPDGKRLAARMKVRCRSDADAAEAALQLTRVTALLRDLIAREHQKANPADLSGVLTEGSFRSAGRQVFGYWPIEWSFVDNMLGVPRP
jgi:hypothetical protein